MPPRLSPAPKVFHKTALGRIVNGDSLDVLATYADKTVDLIMTSPPFGLVRKKDYGNVEAHEYVEWFRPFGEQFKRVLKDNGSLVIDIGGAWMKGTPTRSLYHFKLLILLCEEFGFHLAQDFYWWNPSKLPTPAEWVTVRRVRVKDAINTVWWLSKTPWPKASNRRVLQPYSPSMRDLLEKGYRAKKRPSGHDISKNFSIDNGAAIPPNLIAIPNTESNSFYLRYCEEHGFKPHPARYPAELPEYFIRMLTDPGDVVVDPFGEAASQARCASASIVRGPASRCWKNTARPRSVALSVIRSFQLNRMPIRATIQTTIVFRAPAFCGTATREMCFRRTAAGKEQLSSKSKRDEVAVAETNGHKKTATPMHLPMVSTLFHAQRNLKNFT